jgi:hypothetical protein
MHAQGQAAMNHRTHSVCYLILIDPDGNLNDVDASGITIVDDPNNLAWDVVGQPQTNDLGTRMKLKLKCSQGHSVRRRVFADAPPDSGTVTVTLPDGNTVPDPTVNVPVVYVNDKP